MHFFIHPHQRDFIFYFFSTASFYFFATQPRGCADGVACFGFRSVSAARSLSFLWLAVFSCDIFAHRCGCVETEFFCSQAPCPRFAFRVDFAGGYSRRSTAEL